MYICDLSHFLDDFVVRRCLACGTEGQVSNWQDSFRDSSVGRPDA